MVQRDTLPDGHGMLFVHAAPKRAYMGMRNARIPLSAAFLDDKGDLINIAGMRRESSDIHCAARPARCALKMRRDGFAYRGISPGIRIKRLNRRGSNASP